MRRVQPSDCHMGTRIITLKSSLVNPSEASSPGTMETRGTLWSRNLPVINHEKPVSVPFGDVDPDGVILRAARVGVSTVDQSVVNGSASAPRSTASASAVGFPVSSFNLIPAAARAARGCPCARCTSDANCRRSGAAVHRQHRDAAEAIAERGQNLIQSIRAPDQRQRSGGVQNPRRRRCPISEYAVARRMRHAPDGIRRDILPCRIVERRVHQHMIGRSGSNALGREIVGGRRDIQHNGANALFEAVPHNVLRCDVRQFRIDFQKRHVHAGQRTASARLAAPTPARTRQPGRRAARRSRPPAGWRRDRRGGLFSSASAGAGRRAPRHRSSPVRTARSGPQLMRQARVLQELRATSQYS